jgi:surfeit locus 1 family protein
MTISTTPPSSERELNWLNIFYAAEWIIFAGFALYLWYRLMRDEWERESELTPRDAE